MKKLLLALLFLSSFFLLYKAEYAFSEPEINLTNITAEGGNTTYIDFDLSQQTNIWQGFFGRVSGGITLEDASGSIFYDWNVVIPSGEIFATRNYITDWSMINCSNQTQIYEEEERLNIQNESSQSINKTFLDYNHPDFDVSGKLISGCRSTKTHNSTDPQAAFWNVILNSNSTNTVYATIIQADTIGYNGTVVDFQILVPVDRLTGKAVYNIYLELN